MLQPKKTKFRKMSKGRNRGLAQVGNKVSFGDFGLKTTGRGRITARQIEAARRAISRALKRGGDARQHCADGGATERVERIEGASRVEDAGRIKRSSSHEGFARAEESGKFERVARVEES